MKYILGFITLAIFCGVMYYLRQKALTCSCGGRFTDGGGYNHYSCNKCGKHLTDK